MKRRPATAPPFSTAAAVDEVRCELRAARRRRWKLAARVLLWSFVSLWLLAVCVGFAVSSGFRPGCRSRQWEARTNLKALYVAQETFRGEHDRYGTLDELGFQPRGTVRRYRYALEEVSARSFRALAVATTPTNLAGDVWVIDDELALDNVVNACAR